MAEAEEEAEAAAIPAALAEVAVVEMLEPPPYIVRSVLLLVLLFCATAGTRLVRIKVVCRSKHAKRRFLALLGSSACGASASMTCQQSLSCFASRRRESRPSD